MHVIDEWGKEREKVKTVDRAKKDLQEAYANLITQKHGLRQTTSRPKGDNSAYRAKQADVKAAKQAVEKAEKEFGLATGVVGGTRASLVVSGAAAGMGAPYVGAGATLMKGADSLWRSGTDADLTKKRGEIIAEQYNTRQRTKGDRAETSDRRSVKKSVEKRLQELREIAAAKEAEAIEKQLGLMKAASALDAEYEWLRHKSETDIARAKLGTSAAEQLWIDAAVAGSQIAADAVANAVVPGAGIALQGVRSFGEASQEARRAGASVGQQVTYGGAVAGLEMGTEKYIDGFAGAYGKGVRDKQAERLLSKYIPNISPKAVSRLVDVAGEAAKPIVNYGLEMPVTSIYNGNNPLDNYNMDGFSDALRNAAIQGVTSGAIDAWSDAQNWALDNVYDAAISPQTQSALRRAYVGSFAQPSAESYAALIKMLYNKKGDGHRW